MGNTRTGTAGRRSTPPIHIVRGRHGGLGCAPVAASSRQAVHLWLDTSAPRAYGRAPTVIATAQPDGRTTSLTVASPWRSCAADAGSHNAVPAKGHRGLKKGLEKPGGGGRKSGIDDGYLSVQPGQQLAQGTR